MKIISRTLALLAGITILYFLFDYVAIERKGIPVGEGYYGLMMFPSGIYLSIVFISYGVGAQKFLRKIAPKFASKL